MPNWQPFTPDYKFLSDVLQVKTDKYNTNYKQLNDLYNKVVYGDLSRKDTNERREQYAQQLSPKLEQISGLDLSVAQNVESAKQVFTPFFDDDLTVKDLVYTKQGQSEMQYANSLLNSSDPDRRTKYWQTGVKALQYQMEDFVNADPDKALQMGLPKYIEDADLYKKAMAYLDESGLTHTSELPDESNFFLVTTKNGAQITDRAYQMVQRALLDDPAVQQAYYTQAYVASRDFAKAGMESGIFQSVDEGRAAWANETINNYQNLLVAQIAKNQDEVNKYKNISANWQQYLADEGIIPGSYEDIEYQEVQSKYEAALLDLQTRQKTIRDSGSVNTDSIEGLVNKAYNLLMGYNIQSDLTKAAVDYSNLDVETKLKANDYMRDYVKQKRQFEHDFAKMAQKHIYDKELEGIKLGIGLTSSLLDQAVSMTKLGTSEVKLDENGNPVDPLDQDYLQLNDADFQMKHQAISSDKISAALSALEKVYNTDNGIYTIPGTNHTGTLVQLKQKLLSNPALLADFYSSMNHLITQDTEKLKESNPSFVQTDDYAQLFNTFTNINRTTATYMMAEQRANDVYKSNFNTALTTKAIKEAEAISKGLEEGRPSIFDENNRVLSEEEYLTKYTDYNVDQEASLQSNQSMPIWYGTVNKDFPKEVADARNFYRMQKKLLNATLSGALVVTPESGETVNPYQYFDLNSALSGIPASEITAGEVITNPYYTTYVDPKIVNIDPNVNKVWNEFLNQYVNTAYQDAKFYSGDIGEISVDDLEDKAANAETAKKVIAAYLQEFRQRQIGGGKAQVHGVNINYAPAYGPTDRESLSKTEAAYVIQIDNDFLQKITGKNKLIPEGQAAEYSSITFSFPKERDLSGRAQSNLNFSNYETQMSLGASNVFNVYNGGKLVLQKNADNHLIAKVTPLNYNTKTNNIETLTPRYYDLTQKMNDAGQNKKYIDELVDTYLKRLNDISEANINAEKQNKRAKQN